MMPQDAKIAGFVGRDLSRHLPIDGLKANLHENHYQVAWVYILFTWLKLVLLDYDPNPSTLLRSPVL